MAGKGGWGEHEIAMLVQNPRARPILDDPPDGRRQRRRHRPRPNPVVPGHVHFNLVPVPGCEPQLWGGTVVSSKPDDRLADLCGGLAMSSVVVMWLIGLFGVVEELVLGTGFWGGLLLPSIGLAFLLSHLLGFLSDGLSDSRCPWGMRAFGCFWVSTLMWVPLGMLLGGVFG